MAANDTSRRALGGPRVIRRAGGATPGGTAEARRSSHQTRAAVRRIVAGADRATTRTTGTDLVVYRPPAERRPATSRVVERLTQLYYSAALALHRLQHRPPK